ncbi:MAG: HAD family hydrolase [Methylocystaceae bacterium]|nr:HAD family hydrolase [Methylocystaceae bacterium]
MSLFDKYKSWFFDFDGVILDSNKVKTDAFFEAAKKYGTPAAQALVDHHVSHGGISRFVKAEYLFNDILKRPAQAGEIDQFLTDFAKAVTKGLMTCAQTPGLNSLMSGPLKNIPCHVISGSMQTELRDLMEKRDILGYFDNVFGSPDSKDHIFARELKNGTIQQPAVYIGDSLYDFEMADKYGLDFIFAYDWTEFSDWQNFFQDKDVLIVKNLAELA